MKLSEQAKEYAIRCHEETNHLYDGKPYAFHLQMAVNVAERFMDGRFSEREKELIRAGCWVHDVIEDCRQTYNDVRSALGTEVAEIAYALTNEKGRNRRERANDRYYQGIRETPLAAFVKLCDRIANVEHSKSSGNRMLHAYRRELSNFLAKVHAGVETVPLEEYLKEFLSEQTV
ncbi:MAG: HD domain-containing protein [Bacteroidota bacterium]